MGFEQKLVTDPKLLAQGGLPAQPGPITLRGNDSTLNGGYDNDVLLTSLTTGRQFRDPLVITLVPTSKPALHLI